MAVKIPVLIFDATKLMFVISAATAPISVASAATAESQEENGDGWWECFEQRACETKESPIEQSEAESRWRRRRCRPLVIEWGLPSGPHVRRKALQAASR